MKTSSRYSNETWKITRMKHERLHVIHLGTVHLFCLVNPRKYSRQVQTKYKLIHSTSLVTSNEGRKCITYYKTNLMILQNKPDGSSGAAKWKTISLEAYVVRGHFATVQKVLSCSFHWVNLERMGWYIKVRTRPHLSTKMNLHSLQKW